MAIKETGKESGTQNPLPPTSVSQIREGELQIGEEPFAAFESWLSDAKQNGLPEPTAMSLATASRAGRPAVRIVLYKGSSLSHDGRRGIEFYTNYESAKSRDLVENPFAATVFHWVVLHRQIRFEGRIEKLSPVESNLYFQTRSRGSRIGAWSSPQSQKIATREELKRLVAATERRFEGQELLCPPHWGGWRLVPDKIEFWEERPYRLHERKVFQQVGLGWETYRLAP